MATPKSRSNTIDEYIKASPENVQPILQTLRRTIKEEAPQSEETISYNMPTFNLNGTYLVYFAAWKKHIAFYPTSSEMEAAIPELAAYKKGQGTLQFPLNQPMPLPLIRRVVQFRAKENLEKRNR
jgi:uncharacterized protein YdhG (YjbR/CyaY superfamily)